MKQINFKPRFFLFLSFIEGGVVMAAELIGAKILAPFFGTSLYVWSTVMAITLGGLAMGYFIGGWLSHKKKSVKTLLIVTLLASVFVMIMPVMAKFLMEYMILFNFFTALIISTVIFLFPPVFLMGMVSPLIINLVTTEKEKAGMMSGLVYAISTLGGIISTFLTGFYIVPEFGLTMPCIFFGIILGVVPFLVLVTQKNLFSIIFPLLGVFCIQQASATLPSSQIKVLYDKEGLMGQLMVADVPHVTDKKNSSSYDRYLFMNRVAQSVISDSGKTLLPYIELIKKIVPACEPDRKQALILGLGGGSLSGELLNKGYVVEACELDERMHEVSKKYFGLSPKISVMIDDARHYIETTQKKYDLIVFDVFKGEENPDHVFTKESISRALELLNENGIIIVNGNGYWNGTAGLGMRSIAKTLLETKLDLNIYSFSNNEAARNLEFVASRNKISFSDSSVVNITIDAASMADAVVLEDDKPVLSVINREANLAWRKGYTLSVYQFIKANVPVFQ